MKRLLVRFTIFALASMRDQRVRAFDVPITGSDPVHAVAIKPFVVFRELRQIQSLFQSLRQLGVRWALTAAHPRMTTVAAVDILLQELREAESIP